MEPASASQPGMAMRPCSALNRPFRGPTMELQGWSATQPVRKERLQPWPTHNDAENKAEYASRQGSSSLNTWNRQKGSVFSCNGLLVGSFIRLSFSLPCKHAWRSSRYKHRLNMHAESQRQPIASTNSVRAVPKLSSQPAVSLNNKLQMHNDGGTHNQDQHHDHEHGLRGSTTNMEPTYACPAPKEPPVPEVGPAQQGSLG